MWLYLRMWLLLCSYILIDKFSFQFKEKVYSYAKGQGSKFRLVVVGPLDSDRKKNIGKLSKVEHRLPNPIGYHGQHAVSQTILVRKRFS